MIKINEKEKELEVLLSTMNRTSLSFLSNMFPEDDYLNYQILIVNQTSKEKLLTSNHPNIRVINSFEKGLSKSRNIAIKNAKKNICLLADDDVRYKKNFKEKILNAFQNNEIADIITFQMIDDEGKLFKEYPDIKIHDKKTINSVNTVVIAFKLEVFKKNDVCFNTHFGLGALFPTADEYVFLRNALRAGLKMYFEPQIILEHDYFSSGRAVNKDEVIFARGALFYKYSGTFAYLRLCKHLFLLCKRKKITLNQVFKKYNAGFKGMLAYKKLLKNELEIR